MKTTISKYDGICKVTGENYTVGTEIAGIPGGWMIARYATVEGIREWAEAQKAKMIEIRSTFESAEKLERRTRNADKGIETLVKEWPSAMRGFISPHTLTASLRNMVALAGVK